jgi:hypothetical protein
MTMENYDSMVFPATTSIEFGDFPAIFSCKRCPWLPNMAFFFTPEDDEKTPTWIFNHH